MEKPERLSLKTENLINENILKLGELFPDILTEIEKDGKLIKTINVEKLKELVGDYADKDTEIYELTWAGKQNARRCVVEPTTKTLRPVIEDSVDFENTENLYIEGDNLEVLKILRKSYSNFIKMIYIDPPYNRKRKNDLIYKDNFSMSKEDYEKEAGVVDEEGNKLIKNTGFDGRFHSNWLNMMYPRLQLAYKLLKKDGVIFISIDDNEVANLRKLCDEIFGEDNFVGEIIRKTKSMTGDEGSGFNLQHENLVIYSKNKKQVILNGEEKSFDNYKNPDNDDNGDWTSGDPSAKSGSGSTYFEIINPITNKVDLPPKGRYWAFSQNTLKEYIKNGKIKFKHYHKDNERGFIFKRYKNELQSLFNPVNSLFSIENDYMNQVGTKEIKSIFSEEYFDNPKPTFFIQKLIQYSTSKQDYILDFFSGSATTAHAVMQLNAEDGGNRKFIMVQLPEPTDEKSEAHKAGYKNICEIGKERIRRAGNKIKEELKEKSKQKKLEDNNADINNLDFGFRVFKLGESIYKDTVLHPNEITQENLLDFKESIKHGTTQEDILYSVLLDMGIPISAKVEIKTIQNKKVFIINDGWLVACFDENIDLELIKELAKIKSEIPGLKTKFVFKESSFKDDSAIINTMEYLKTKIFKTDAELKSNVKVV
ncbi:site-specific DNA-methyltransferase [Methanococcus aeolicus]|uniref:site-specific DNA-methyltransferase n=1 Tax=Methanococcus aeolicus TaxID=42879 RepID=UPI0021CA1BB5|nr:DNA methyltransferase [Methanococcus aeolicus]UXM85122.1 DNA methyltransferase [Methanococcus aeolicus]